LGMTCGGSSLALGWFVSREEWGMPGATSDGLTVECSCGAVGNVLPPDFGYEPRDIRTPLLEWRGGKVGAGRVAVELLPLGVSICPVCQRRACAYVKAAIGR